MKELYAVWFHTLPLNENFKHILWRLVGDFEKIAKANKEIYEQWGVQKEWISKIEIHKYQLERLEQDLEQWKRLNIQIITLEDTDYPFLLKQIHNPPFVLFVLGEKSYLKEVGLSIVGSRKCSEYGFYMGQKLAAELVEQGLMITSGMAIGIDEAAHKGALSRKGKTIAVLGCGVDQCYPKHNISLYRQIIEKGCIISEFLPSTQPLPHHFPMRNRIISGLSVGTVVVEASERSGSLITAALALEQNRDVFAVPGNVESIFSKGTNELIKNGAKLVSEAKDIIEEIHPMIPFEKCGFIDNCKNNVYQTLDKVEIIVYDNLSWQPVDLTKLVSLTKVSQMQIENSLVKLEIKGLVARLPAKRYVRLN